LKSIHTLAITAGHQRALRILLIGSGGNGSAVLAGLPYLHHAMLAWGFRSGLEVTVVDGDTVSPTNCVRQPFGASDIGLNKATVLVSRLNLFHGLAWRAVSVPFTRELSLGFSYDRAVDFVISCVDTSAARRAMDEAFNSASGSWSKVHYWLDLGNNAGDGQFVLGQPLNAANRRSRSRLRTVAELFPSIVDPTLGEDPAPSCSAAEALDRQEPFINNVLATSALSMLTRLIRYGEIAYHGAFYNSASGRGIPLAVDPDAWERSRRRAKRAQAEAVAA